jgi:hypothetical protein
MKTGDIVKIKVEMPFGIITVTFTVIDILPEGYYGLIANHNIVVGKLFEEEEERFWILSEATNIMASLLTIDLNKYHDEI